MNDVIIVACPSLFQFPNGVLPTFETVMYLILALRGFILAIIFAALLTERLRFLRSTFLAYGKLVTTALPPASSLSARLGTLTVPKTWFAHFYLVNLALTLVTACEIRGLLTSGRLGALLKVLRRLDTPEMGDREPVQECILGLAFMIMQLGRRSYECLFVERASTTAKMHVAHYAVGLGYYFTMVMGSWAEGAANLGVWSDEPTLVPPLRSFLQPHHLLALSLFLYASVHQYHCHSILASLRSAPATPGAPIEARYSIPRGDWFEYVTTPHYFCDVLVYFSFCVLTRFQNWTLILTFSWTVINLGIVAKETDAWYKHTFGDKYKEAFPRGRWAMLPGIF
ncbi:3-oxo-5-alpha-steroid 4-dehydrogenase-domain-containing protein [Jimgerdemannia flammicorona]|uniref:3-oxo-5-alpha-steroid 4-dehydrogenase-domain-containing protein n=2 Tax=Jimgerdemannia flammicorona TaxID=994334 RepID=A0A433QJW0_9FUNG|nr:3-oxo-5-alpha-steroid 4-dehydrogenase-domain-containing protein [Jimgerdemannia flammicorona]RUS30058.1 3-oxo-5-alpha-steroid 4-dehydrogenase-domain-containing protein [Jimgerdemannia flammicorona]